MRKIGDAEKVFSKKGELSQAVILSLIQQLGFAFPSEDETKLTMELTWIQSALLVLDVESPDVSPHVVTVLHPLLGKMEKAYGKWTSKPQIQMLFKLTMHVLNSLLK
jgi:hypothetical protein